MKLLFTIIFTLLCGAVKAQDCGVWVKKDTITPWTKVKDFKKAFSDDTAFAESEWTLTSGTRGSYRSSSCPCECYDNYTEIQYRIKPKNGVQQKRIRTVYFIYVPKEKSPYEQIIDSISK